MYMLQRIFRQFGVVNFFSLFSDGVDADKKRGGRDIVTQTPLSKTASDEDNSLGYKGTVLSPSLQASNVRLTILD